MKYLIYLLSFHLLFSCCKSNDTFKPLLESDKGWLPYNVGDSLLFYRGDSLVYTTTIINSDSGTRTNKPIEGCSLPVEKSETYQIFLDSIKNISYFPLLINIGYTLDKLAFADYDERNGGISPVSGFIPINSAPSTSIEINKVNYENVKVLKDTNNIVPIIYGTILLVSLSTLTFS